MNHTTGRFALVNSLSGILLWLLWKLEVVSNVRIVSKSPADFSPPIGAFMALRSNANLPCLVKLALFNY